MSTTRPVDAQRRHRVGYSRRCSGSVVVSRLSCPITQSRVPARLQRSGELAQFRAELEAQPQAASTLLSELSSNVDPVVGQWVAWIASPGAWSSGRPDLEETLPTTLTSAYARTRCTLWSRSIQPGSHRLFRNISPHWTVQTSSRRWRRSGVSFSSVLRLRCRGFCGSPIAPVIRQLAITHASGLGARK